MFSKSEKDSQDAGANIMTIRYSAPYLKRSVESITPDIEHSHFPREIVIKDIMLCPSSNAKAIDSGSGIFTTTAMKIVPRSLMSYIGGWSTISD